MDSTRVPFLASVGVWGRRRPVDVFGSQCRVRVQASEFGGVELGIRFQGSGWAQSLQLILELAVGS